MDDDAVVSVELDAVVRDRTEFNLSDGTVGDSGETNDGNYGG